MYVKNTSPEFISEVSVLWYSGHGVLRKIVELRLFTSHSDFRAFNVHVQPLLSGNTLSA